jgi:hypothetical protein
MVVNRNRKRSLSPNLTDNILIKDREDFVGGRQARFGRTLSCLRNRLIPDDVVAEFNALITNEHGGARNQLADFMLTLSAKRAVQKLLARALLFGHCVPRFREKFAKITID